MRGILIDPFTRTVSEVETTGKLAEIYELLGVGTITVVSVNDTDALYLDDEGLFVPAEEQAYFQWRGSNQPYAGRGLILGTDEEGDSTDAVMHLWEVASAVVFLNNDEVNPEEYLGHKIYVLEDGKWIEV